MSNILKVTTPLIDRSTLNPVRPEEGNHTQDMKIQNPVSTEKVSRPDIRDDAAPKNEEQDIQLNYNSNFNAFARAIGKNPELLESLSRLFQMGAGLNISSGIRAGTAAEISGLLEMLPTKPSELDGVMKEQFDAANRFRGPFFDLFRQALSENDSMPLQQDIIRFLKRYVDYTSAGHIQERMKTVLSKCHENMIKSAAKTLSEKTEGLFERNHGQLQVREDARRLKQDVLPFLNKYISVSHDRGILREMTAELTLLLSRYEGADREGLMEGFQKLKGYAAFQKYFGTINEVQFQAVLEKMEEQGQIRETNERLVELLENTLSGSKGADAKELAQNVLHSLLLNESVYMPLLHTMLPLNVDGKMFYSEMWVNPDAGDQREEKSEGRAVRALIKFDIQDLGFFDLFFHYADGRAEMQINYPETLRDREREIRENIRRILDEQGISCKTLILEGTGESIPLSEAFPEIYERRNVINVRV